MKLFIEMAHSENIVNTNIKINRIKIFVKDIGLRRKLANLMKLSKTQRLTASQKRKLAVAKRKVELDK